MACGIVEESYVFTSNKLQHYFFFMSCVYTVYLYVPLKAYRKMNKFTKIKMQFNFLVFFN